MIQKVSRAIQRGSQDAEYVKALTNIGVDVIGDTPEHFDASIRASLPSIELAAQAASPARRYLPASRKSSTSDSTGSARIRSRRHRHGKAVLATDGPSSTIRIFSSAD